MRSLIEAIGWAFFAAILYGAIFGGDFTACVGAHGYCDHAIAKQEKPE